VQLTFPHLSGAPLGANLNALGNWTTYDLQPSTPYEAVVRFDADTKKLDTVMLLYKKAPLVQRVGVYKLPEVTNSLLDSYDWKFASSATSCVRIMSVTTEPVTEPVIKLLPWSEKQYVAARKQIKDNGARTFKDYGLYASWFKHNDHAVVLNDTLCGDLGTAGETHSWRNEKTPILPYALPLIIGTECFTVMTATDDDRYVYQAQGHRPYWNRHGNGNKMWHEPGTVIPIHGVNSFEDYTAWFEKLYNDRALFNIVVRNKE
jgi:hypothetical protein